MSHFNSRRICQLIILWCTMNRYHTNATYKYFRFWTHFHASSDKRSPILKFNALIMSTEELHVAECIIALAIAEGDDDLLLFALMFHEETKAKLDQKFIVGIIDRAPVLSMGSGKRRNARSFGAASNYAQDETGAPTITLAGGEYYALFRFAREHVPELRTALKVPDMMRLPCGGIIDGEEALLIMLFYLAYPSRHTASTHFFGRATALVDRICFRFVSCHQTNTRFSSGRSRMLNKKGFENKRTSKFILLNDDFPNILVSRGQAFDRLHQRDDEHDGEAPHAQLRAGTARARLLQAPSQAAVLGRRHSSQDGLPTPAPLRFPRRNLPTLLPSWPAPRPRGGTAIPAVTLVWSQTRPRP